MLTPEETADRLEELHRSTFGGKSFGRFTLTHEQLRDLSERDKLEKTTVTKIAAHLSSGHGKLLCKVGTIYGVIDEAKIVAWRPVPNKLTRYRRV